MQVSRTAIAAAIRATTAVVSWLIATSLWAQGTVGTCVDLPAHLEACEAHECTFTHPFTGSEETRAVEPGDDGVCDYRESMPNGGELTCRYDEAARKAMAAFYQASFDAEANGGAPPDNSILKTALRDGTCKVTGY